MPAFWKDDLDTPCAFCGKDFELVDPPIRTVAIEQSDPLIVRVSNWHMKCVERSGLGLISVSHVWHDAIAAANLSEEDTPEASRCLHRVLSEILPTVQATFRDHFGQVELWHDYLSIPQWQRPMQQALLVMLPHIYKIARLCLIHLDDISTKQIVAAATICAKNILWRSAIYQFWSMPGDETISRHDCMTRSQRSNLTSHQSAFDWSAWWKDEPKKSQSSTPDEYRRYKALVGFFSAKWFQRMWVSLEYPQCQQACVYTKDNVIIWDGESSNCDSFSLLFDGFQQRMRQCIEDIGFNEFRNFFFDMPLPLLGPLADMRRNARSMDGVALCYGEALSFVAGRKCSCYRDRFLAMSSFLRCDDHVSVIQNMPQDATEACLWIAQKCLANGDYSPLLMLRRGQKHHSARWLVGFENMSWKMWDLGPVRTRCQDRKIDLDDKFVHLELVHVGVVEQLWEPKFGDRDHIAVFDYVLGILSCS